MWLSHKCIICISPYKFLIERKWKFIFEIWMLNIISFSVTDTWLVITSIKSTESLIINNHPQVRWGFLGNHFRHTSSWLQYISCNLNTCQKYYILTIFVKSLHVNSLRLSNAYIHQDTKPSLVQIMPCRLSATSHYLNQCWIIGIWEVNTMCPVCFITRSFAGMMPADVLWPKVLVYPWYWARPITK